MIDHISIPVRDLKRSENFYSTVLAVLGYTVLEKKTGTVGFGKKYPEFWINERKNISTGQVSDGFHVCLRAKSIDMVDTFYKIAMELGAVADGAPGYREQYGANYYATFIGDYDGNRIEVVTFA
ncbi:VOC family protein [Shewanella dokdonensis]|uniref:VOC family protein n=1 Tax=Shewanella dokdonensis TaxID=712036 RepID=UPI0020102D3E|nr:VOC family protein [Shewanella dokdonensis]MCL1075434.1 VOC family protein [Shewanella dokdonensis]